MKAIQLKTGRRGEEGSTLMLAVIPMIILSVALVASMQLASSRSKMAVRSQAWNVSLTMSEAGIEEAMAHLNYTEGVNMARFGWTYTGATYYKSNTLGDGSYTVTISTNFSPSITAQGYSRMPAAALLAVAGGQSPAVEQKVRRSVEVTTKRVPPAIGLVAKGKMEVQGDFDVDSYDSSDPNFSGVGGIYASNKVKANGFVGTISTTSGNLIVKDNADIRGNIGAAAPGVISVTTPASVGDAAYVNGGSTGVQSGHRQDNLVASIPNFALPYTGGLTPTSGSFGGTNYNWRLTNGNYRITGTLTIDSGKKMIVTGKARLYVTSTINVDANGFIKINPGASLELYYGSQLYVKGNGHINRDGTPDRFMCIGLTTAAEAYLEGHSFVSGVVHTPQAKLYIQGDAQLCGAGNANEIVLQGQADFHFDEALSTTREGVFQITSWTEK